MTDYLLALIKQLNDALDSQAKLNSILTRQNRVLTLSVINHEARIAELERLVRSLQAHLN